MTGSCGARLWIRRACCEKKDSATLPPPATPLYVTASAALSARVSASERDRLRFEADDWARAAAWAPSRVDDEVASDKQIVRRTGGGSGPTGT
jgi:hypothetical protein